MRNRVADTERLVKVIIYVRKSAGLSQMDLAKALGKSVGTIKKLGEWSWCARLPSAARVV